MTTLWLRDAGRTLRAARGFAVALLLALAAAAFNGALVALMALRLEGLLPGPFAQMGHFTEPHHRTHDLTFALLFLPAVVGVLAQLRRPLQNIAGMLMALVPSAALVVTLLLTLIVAGDTGVLQPPWVLVMAATLAAAVLHPAGRVFFASFSRSRVSRTLLALVVVAAVPLLVFAAVNVGLQGAVPDDHAAAGHYGFMAAFGLTVVGVGVLASLRPDGWRLTAGTTALLPALLGAISLLNPDAASSLDTGWALAAIAWSAAFSASIRWASAARGDR